MIFLRPNGEQNINCETKIHVDFKSCTYGEKTGTRSSLKIDGLEQELTIREALVHIIIKICEMIIVYVLSRGSNASRQRNRTHLQSEGLKFQ